MKEIMFKAVNLGIVDCNDNPLSEGDVVEMSYTALNQPFEIKGVIRYSKSHAQFVVSKNNTFLSRVVPLSVSNRHIKRLGSIYDDPKLLK